MLGGRRLTGRDGCPAGLGVGRRAMMGEAKGGARPPNGTKASGPQGCSSARDAAHREVQAGSEKMRAPILHNLHVGEA